MLSYGSSGVPVVEAREDFRTRLEIRRNLALLSATVAANVPVRQLRRGCLALVPRSCSRPLDMGERALDGDTLAALWLAGGALELVALALVVGVRPDPKAIHNTDSLRRTQCTHSSQ